MTNENNYSNWIKNNLSTSVVEDASFLLGDFSGGGTCAAEKCYYANVILQARSKKPAHCRDAQRRVRCVIPQTRHPVGCPYGANRRTGL